MLKQIVMLETNPLLARPDLDGIWHITLFIGIAIGICAWVKDQWDRHNVTFEMAVLWAYVMIYSLYLFEYPSEQFAIYTTAFQATAGQAFVEALFIPLGAMLLAKHAWRVLPWVVGAELVCIWMGWGGLFSATSFNSAFCALAIPFLPIWMVIIAIITILTHHGWTAIAILGAQSLAFAIRVKKYRNIRFSILFLCIATFVLGALIHPQILEGTQRVWKWKEFMQLWWDGGPLVPWLGVGPNTFYWTSYVQSDAKQHFFPTMHCDWLQILWSLGGVGLGLSLAIFFRATIRAWNDPKLLSALFGCAAFGLTYSPLEYFPSAFLVALIILSKARLRSASQS